LSVMFHCILENGFCTVDDCWFGRLELPKLAECIYYYAYQRYNRFIPNIYFENLAGVFDGLKTLIVHYAPAAPWNIVGIPVDKTPNAKVNRIGRVKAEVDHGKIVLNSRASSMQECLKHLIPQLKANQSNYQVDGHDDFADCLGLVVEVLKNPPSPVTWIPPRRNGPPYGSGGDNGGQDEGAGGLCTG
jgi:hypothetical protein